MIKKTIYDFLDDRITEPANDRSAKYLEIGKKLKKRNGKILAILYFLMEELNVKSVATLFSSVRKVSRLIYVLNQALTRKAVTDEYAEAFNEFVKKSVKRMDHVLRIMKEDLYLTEYWPFFREVGFDDIFDFELTGDYAENNRRLLLIKERFLVWKSDHTTEIEEHMTKVQPMVTALDEERKKRKEDAIAEKEKKKAYERSIEDEIRQRRKYDEDRKRREKKIERELSVYYA